MNILDENVMEAGNINADVPSPGGVYTVDFDLDLNLDVNLSVNTTWSTIWSEANTLTDSMLTDNNFSTIDERNHTIGDATFNGEYFSDSNSTPVTSDLIWNAFQGIEQFSLKNVEDTATELTALNPTTSDLFIYQSEAPVNNSDDLSELSENGGYDILKDSLFELDLFGETLKDIDHISANFETSTPESTPIVDWNRRRSLLYDKNEFVRSPPDTRSYRKHQESIKIKNQTTSVPGNKTVEEQRSYRCSVRDCEKTYCKASHLKSHMRRHSGFKPFACDWDGCKWRFSRSDELARHKRSHSGIKPYSCDLCDKAFSRSDHLSKHAKVHMKKLALYGTPIITKKCNYKYLNVNRIKVE